MTYIIIQILIPKVVSVKSNNEHHMTSKRGPLAAQYAIAVRHNRSLELESIYLPKIMDSKHVPHFHFSYANVFLMTFSPPAFKPWPYCGPHLASHRLIGRANRPW